MAERLRVLGVFVQVMEVNEKTKMALRKLHTYLSTATVVQFYNHLKTKSPFFLENGSFQMAFAVKRRDACH